MLRPIPDSEPRADLIPPPHSHAAEQALLGALLMNGKAVERIYGFLRGEHFAEPLHGRIYEAIHGLIERGSVADATTVRAALGEDADLTLAGGAGHLGRLIGAATRSNGVGDYARLILDCHLRCRLIDAGETIINGARGSTSAVDQIGAAIDALDALGRQAGQDGLRGVDDYRDDVMALYRGERKMALSTGFAALDPYYRIRPGELTIVTGVPSSGKSELIDAIAVNLAMREGHKFAVCSFENSPDEHIGKLCEKYVGEPFHQGRTEQMTSDSLGIALDWVNRHFHFIRAEKDSPTVDWAIARAKSAVDRYKIKGVIFDPYNEFEHKRPAGMSEAEYISQALSKVKRFASNNGVHVWFIAHPAKPMQDRRDDVPSLYDISGGAAWANKADCGISVHRPFLPSGERSRDVAVHVKKIRFRAVGKPGIAELRFDPTTGRYSGIETPSAQHWTDEP